MIPCNDPRHPGLFYFSCPVRIERDIPSGGRVAMTVAKHRTEGMTLSNSLFCDLCCSHLFENTRAVRHDSSDLNTDAKPRLTFSLSRFSETRRRSFSMACGMK